MSEQLPPIHVVRGHRVVLDRDLARLYGVPTRQLNQAVKRNLDRFPEDFRFQLTREEYVSPRSQFVILDPQVIGRQMEETGSSPFSAGVTKPLRPNYLPWVFTEHGALMAATVLNSPRAVHMSLFVIRAFVRLRETLGAHRELAAKLSELERKVAGHDGAIRDLFEAMRRLLEPPKGADKEMGFHTTMVRQAGDRKRPRG